jgi:hypothetical protein
MKTPLAIAAILAGGAAGFGFGFLGESPSAPTVVEAPAAEISTASTATPSVGQATVPKFDEARFWSLAVVNAGPWQLLDMEREIAGMTFEQALAAIARAEKLGSKLRRPLYAMLIQHAHRLDAGRLKAYFGNDVQVGEAMFTASSFVMSPAFQWLSLFPEDAQSLLNEWSGGNRNLVLGAVLGRKFSEQLANGENPQMPARMTPDDISNLAITMFTTFPHRSDARALLPYLDKVSPSFRITAAETIVDSALANGSAAAALATLREIQTKFGPGIVKQETIEATFTKLAASDLAGAMKAADSFSGEQRTAAMFGIVPKWMEADPSAAISSLAGSGMFQNIHLGGHLEPSFTANPSAWKAAVRKMQPGPDREALARIVVNGMADAPDADYAEFSGMLAAQDQEQARILAAADSGKLLDLFLSTPADKKRELAEFMVAMEDFENKTSGVFDPDKLPPADFDALILAVSRTDGDMVEFIEKMHNPEMRAEAYRRAAAHDPQAALKNPEITRHLSPETLEFYRRYTTQEAIERPFTFEAGPKSGTSKYYLHQP